MYYTGMNVGDEDTDDDESIESFVGAVSEPDDEEDFVGPEPFDQEFGSQQRAIFQRVIDIFYENVETQPDWEGWVTNYYQHLPTPEEVVHLPLNVENWYLCWRDFLTELWTSEIPYWGENVPENMVRPTAEWIWNRLEPLPAWAHLHQEGVELFPMEGEGLSTPRRFR
jgi:hypothetical protein